VALAERPEDAVTAAAAACVFDADVVVRRQA